VAYQEALKKISLDADASIAQYTGISGMPGAASPNYGHQYSFVRLTGSHTCGLVTDAATAAIGVLQSKPQKVGTAATVAELAGGGVSYVIAGAAVAAGDEITADANGHGITAAAGNLSHGTAVEAAAAGALIPVALHPSRAV